MRQRDPGHYGRFMRPRPLVLVILDGFGERSDSGDNAIRLARTPSLTALNAEFPHGLLSASGLEVGLPAGQMGSSEVGHLNLGSGRVAAMDMSRIDAAIQNGSFAKSPALVKLLEEVRAAGGRLHLLGLVSDGGVHASLSHLLALIDVAREACVPVLVHAFLDGREVLPGTAPAYLECIEARLAGGVGRVASVSGRSWAMDRDRHWDRIARSFRAIVHGHAPVMATSLGGVRTSYAAGVTDEFVEPFVVGGYSGVQTGDAALHFNFRPDRARQLTQGLALATFDAFERPAGEAPFLDRYVCMTVYDERFALPTLLERQRYLNTFGEVIARAGFTQYRCAETEKYAHVTYFFSGGREAPFEGETRRLIDSDSEAATPASHPEMKAAAVADAVCTAIASGKHDFILVNFANPDAVGHTGDLQAAIQAVEAVDVAIGRIVREARHHRGAVVVTADHGNCEQMRDVESGQPHTGHTQNPVPILYVNDRDRDARVRLGGRLCDVAPTLLELMELPQPPEMTGRTLLAR